MQSKILVVEDNTQNRELLVDGMSKSFKVFSACNGKEALEILKAEPNINAILLDLNMPVMTGYELLEIIQKSVEYKSIPVIVLTSSDSDSMNTQIESLNLGAVSVLGKPYDFKVIPVIVNNLIKLQKEAVELNKTNDKDSLTGLYTKEAFTIYGQMRVNSALASKTDLDLVVISLTNIKVTNELYGREDCDITIKELAQRLLEEFPSGLISRLDGARFGVLIESRNNLEDICVELKNEFSTNQRINNLKIKFSMYKNIDLGVKISSSLDRALVALDSTSHGYETLVSYFSENQYKKAVREQEIISCMPHSLKNGDFKIYYQPKYDIHSEHVVGGEALVRWIHPIYGFMAPGEFIPILERVGLISDLDIYVWDTVCKDILYWNENNLQPVPISVNASRRDIINEKYINQIIDTVYDKNIDPSLIRLEITETAFIEDESDVASSTQKLRENNIRIEMDDFGVGYSNLTLLSEIQIDALKFDMKFLKDVCNNPRKKLILTSCINIAKQLNISTIQEGVETKEEVELLRKAGSDVIQGYYFSKPLPRNEFEQLLKCK